MSMYPTCHLNPADCNESAAKATIGGLYTFGGRVFAYTQFKDAIAYLVGHVVTFKDSGLATVTNDITGSANASTAAGVVMDVMTQDYYGYLLVQGLHQDVLKKPGVDTFAETDLVWVSSDTDGMGDKSAFGGTSGSPTAAQLLLWAVQNRGVVGRAINASDDTNDDVACFVSTIHNWGAYYGATLV